jgi:FlaA1/EpsC-like NDP-sugar epimerase
MAITLSLTSVYKKSIAFAYDLLMIPVAWFLAYWFRFNLNAVPDTILSQALYMLLPLICIQGSVYWLFGLYRGIWRFASIPDFVRIIKAVVVGSLAAAAIIAFFTDMQYVPRSVFPLYVVFLITGLGGSRLSYRWLRHHVIHASEAKRVLIIGAGHSGEGLVRDLLRHVAKQYLPVAIVDDDRNKKGLEIHGVRVVGSIDHIESVVKKYNVELIIIAIPSANSADMRRVVALCEKTKLPFRTLPGLKDLTLGKVSINALREVSIEDLLGRDQVTLDWQAIEAEISGKVVLVSGGGGSIGAELCRQVARLNPAVLVVVEKNEFNLYRLDLELRQAFPNLQLHVYLVDVIDKIAIAKILAQHQPEIIFHAAAYKHVPLLESQLRIAVQNNIIGTWVLAEQAVIYGVKQFTLISTDKAVNPTNIMGATKRAAEIICQNFSAQSKTHFVTVRFGNVLGSAGSVVPLFKQQIAKGGPITVTHPEITRYFMTIPEASQLILQATAMGSGGEIFVLDMGEPIKISYLAEQMICLAGLQPHADIQIKYTGLRPGEKLYEELFHESECLVSTEHQKILRAQYRSWDWTMLMQVINNLIIACESGNEVMLQNLLCQLVPEYQTNNMTIKKSNVILEFEDYAKVN